MSEADKYSIANIEKEFLSCIFYKNDSLIQVIDIVRPEMFSNKILSDIYRTMIALYKNESAITDKTVGMSLQEKGIPVDSGVLTSLYHNVYTAKPSKDYAKKIRNSYLCRVLVSDISGILEGVHDKARDSEDIIADLNQVALKANELSVSSETCMKAYVDSDEYIDELEEKLKNDKIVEAEGVKSGIPKLDYVLGGFKAGQLINFTGDSGAGKSFFALQTALNVCKNDLDAVVQYFSLEMGTKELIYERATSMESGINSKKIKQPLLYFLNKVKTSEGYEVVNTLKSTGGEEKKQEYFNKIRRAHETINKMNLFIDEGSNLKIEDVVARAKKLKLQKGRLDLIIVDHTDLLHDQGDPLTDIPKIYVGLKQLAKAMQCPILVLHQFNDGIKNNKDRRPSIFNLKGGSSIRQNCDVVMLLYRPIIYSDLILEKPELKDVCDIAFEKIRGVEKTDPIALQPFNGIMFKER